MLGSAGKPSAISWKEFSELRLGDKRISLADSLSVRFGRMRIWKFPWRKKCKQTISTPAGKEEGLSRRLVSQATLRVFSSEHMAGDGYINGIELRWSLVFSQKFVCIHLLEGKQSKTEKISAIWVRKVDVNGKNNLEISESQVKVEDTFKIFKIEEGVSEEFWLRWVFAKNYAESRSAAGLEKIQFVKPRQHSLKYFRWKLKTTLKIPGMFLHLTAYLFYVSFTHVTANKIYWTLHKAKLTAVKRPNLLDRD